MFTKAFIALHICKHHDDDHPQKQAAKQRSISIKPRHISKKLFFPCLCLLVSRRKARPKSSASALYVYQQRIKVGQIRVKMINAVCRKADHRNRRKMLSNNLPLSISAFQVSSKHGKKRFNENSPLNMRFQYLKEFYF